jgi:hypothetical protein
MIALLLWVTLIVLIVALSFLVDHISNNGPLFVFITILLAIVLVWGGAGIVALSKVTKAPWEPVNSSTNQLTNAVAPVK